MNGGVGSLLFFLWRGLARMLGEKLDVQASYRILHIIVVFFACPIFGILEVLEASRYRYGNSMLNPLGAGLHSIWLVFILVWLLGMFLLAFRSIRTGRQVKHLILQGSMSANLRWQRSVEEASNHVGCRTPIRCRERYGDATPFVTGVCRATIYFPVGSFTPEQMYVMAVHEVNHVKSKDLFWKQLMEVVRILYWPVAPVWFMRRAVDDWSEYCCDFLSCKALGNYVEYFDVLTDLIFQRVQWYRPAWLSTFCNDRTELSMRVRTLVNQKKLDPFRMQCALAVAVLFCLLGSGSVLAATRSMSLEYRVSYWDELVKVNDLPEEEPVPLPESEVSLGRSDEFGLDLIPESRWLDGRIPGYDIAMDPDCMFFDLVLEPGEAAISAILENPMGEDIYMSCSTEEDGFVYVMGIVDAEGVCQYILEEEEMDRANTFHCDEPGKYRFFLANRGEESVSLFGMAGILDSTSD